MRWADLTESWAKAAQRATAVGLSLEKVGENWILNLPAPAKQQVIQLLQRLEADSVDIWRFTQRIVKSPGQMSADLKLFQKIAADPTIAVTEYQKERHQQGYQQLQSLLERSSSFGRPPQMQLFVPRNRDITPQDQAWLRRVTGGGDSKHIDESSAPVLTPSTSPPGHNKPRRAFWTSNLEKSHERRGLQYWTSPWVEYILDSLDPTWWSPIGYVYSIGSEARILPFHNSQDAVDAFNIYARIDGKPDVVRDISWGSESELRMLKEYPWDRISQTWDGVYHSGRYNSRDFTYGWDVASCAWFNPQVLTYRGRVLIKDPHHQ